MLWPRGVRAPADQAGLSLRESHQLRERNASYGHRQRVWQVAETNLDAAVQSGAQDGHAPTQAIEVCHQEDGRYMPAPRQSLCQHRGVPSRPGSTSTWTGTKSRSRGFKKPRIAAFWVFK